MLLLLKLFVLKKKNAVRKWEDFCLSWPTLWQFGLIKGCLVDSQKYSMIWPPLTFYSVLNYWNKPTSTWIWLKEPHSRFRVKIKKAFVHQWSRGNRKTAYGHLIWNVNAKFLLKTLVKMDVVQCLFHPLNVNSTARLLKRLYSYAGLCNGLL